MRRSPYGCWSWLRDMGAVTSNAKNGLSGPDLSDSTAHILCFQTSCSGPGSCLGLSISTDRRSGRRGNANTEKARLRLSLVRALNLAAMLPFLLISPPSPGQSRCQPAGPCHQPFFIEGTLPSLFPAHPPDKANTRED